MSKQLHRLIYYSKSLILGSEDDAVGEIGQILRASRVNNAKVGVTGALLFNSGGFAQVLEGPIEAVSETFERIQCDPRHADVLVLELAPTQERSFSHWSMAFVGQSQKGQQIFGGVSKESGFDPSRLSAEQIFATMHRLMLEEERSAAA